MPDTQIMESDATVEPSVAVAAHLRQRLADGSLDVPMLPEVATQVMSMTRDDESSAAALAGLIQRDVGLAGHVMRMSNSAAYSPRSPIVSLQQAIAWLGIKEVGQISFAVAVRSKVFDAPGHRDVMKTLWRQALASALWAREIARLTRSNVETAYLCGLLHDIGRPVCLHLIGSATEKLGVDMGDDDTADVLNEFAVRAADQVAAEWDLPEEVANAIRHWHCESNREDQHASLATTVCARAFGQFTLDIGAHTRESLGELDVISHLNLYPEDVDELVAKTERILQAVEAT